MHHTPLHSTDGSTRICLSFSCQPPIQEQNTVPVSSYSLPTFRCTLLLQVKRHSIVNLPPFSLPISLSLPLSFFPSFFPSLSPFLSPFLSPSGSMLDNDSLKNRVDRSALPSQQVATSRIGVTKVSQEHPTCSVNQ